MAKKDPTLVDVIIDEATTLVIDKEGYIEEGYSGTVTVTQEVADELLKSGRATIVNTEEK